jgi:rod shape determining protein RodA
MTLQLLKTKARLKLGTIRAYVRPLFSRPYFQAFFILNLIALINFYSIGGLKTLILQTSIFICGTIAAIFISNTDRSIFEQVSIPFYIFNFILLLFVSFVGIRINGARRWLGIGGFTIQPTEFIKLSIIFVIAFYFERRMKSSILTAKYTFFDLLLPLTFAIFPTILICVQPDLGSAIMCLLIAGSILFFMGIERKTIIFIVIGLLISGFIGWKHLRVYQKERVLAFINTNKDVVDNNWQKHQALVAFGSGGLFGKGIKKGTQAQLGYIPEARSDFAMAAFGEEHGFFGIGTVLFLMFFIILKLLQTAKRVRNKFSIVVVVGIAFWLFWQAVINMAMILNIIPVVGIAFPVISISGSSLLILLIGFGIVSSFDRRDR